MHISVHTFPFSTWSSTQVHIVNAPISWNQLINQVLPYSFPLKMSHPFHSPPAVIPPGFQLDPLTLPTYPEIHPQYHCLSHCSKNAIFTLLQSSSRVYSTSHLPSTPGLNLLCLAFKTARNLAPQSMWNFLAHLFPLSNQHSGLAHLC